MVQNNFTIEKAGDEISISAVTTLSELNRVHFFLLGNRFETLYLPSVIVLVEGKCDYRFIERSLALKFPNAQISVIAANSDSRITEILTVARGILTDLQRSPYRDRIFVVLDSVHGAGLPQKLTEMGLPTDNIVKWPLNGIEYYYPPSLLDSIYGLGGTLSIEGDRVLRNGLNYSKNELVERVASLLTATTPPHPEFESLFLGKVAPRAA